MSRAGTQFPPTPWSLIIRIQEGTDEERAQALNEVCESYWQPIYVYARMAGHEPADAEDLAQDFFVRLDRSGLLERATREKGRLRSLLIGAFKRVAADHLRRRRADKRGGRTPHVRLDRTLGERSFGFHQRAGVAPDLAYDHCWALTVFFRALHDVEEEYLQRGRERLFRGLKPVLIRPRQESLREVAARLDTTEAAAKTSLSRLRARFREHFRNIVRTTLTHEQDLDGEMQHLLTLIRELGGL